MEVEQRKSPTRNEVDKNTRGRGIPPTTYIDQKKGNERQSGSPLRERSANAKTQN